KKSLKKINLITTTKEDANPFYWTCQLYRKWDSCLVLLSSCLSKVGRGEELVLGKPLPESLFHKRSFRNGVGAGIKKTSFRRAKP
uniref:Neuropeptide S n=1 Tax=Taeniopygia guttata TaxID=59729 RepID=H0ZMT3_TAEGU